MGFQLLFTVALFASIVAEGSVEGKRKSDRKENPMDCLGVLQNQGYEESAVYNVTLRKSQTTIPVLCDMVTDGGGWTVFQHRSSGNLSFERSFADYISGFGQLHEEFWLGLMNIQELADAAETELRLDITDLDGNDLYETFNNFSLSAGPDYRLYIEPGNYSIGLDVNAGQGFGTLDHVVTSYQCAYYFRGGWWYTDICHSMNLNADADMKMFYITSNVYTELSETKMMLRRKI